jgi:hypothetical protein
MNRSRSELQLKAKKWPVTRHTSGIIAYTQSHKNRRTPRFLTGTFPVQRVSPARGNVRGGVGSM